MNADERVIRIGVYTSNKGSFMDDLKEIDKNVEAAIRMRPDRIELVTGFRTGINIDSYIRQKKSYWEHMGIKVDNIQVDGAEYSQLRANECRGIKKCLENGKKRYENYIEWEVKGE